MRVVGLIVTFIFTACTSVEKTEMTSVQSQNKEQVKEVKSLIINEFDSKGTFVSEYGEACDWIELYNSSDSVIKIGENEWFLSDDEMNPEKYALPEMEIQPHSFVLVLCDEEASTKLFAHANFKISSGQEAITLYHNNEMIDEVYCDEDLKKRFSFGRSTDGSEDWVELENPTPGEANMSAYHYAEAAQ